MTDRACALRGVTKVYGEHAVLEGFDLSVGRGEMVAITGPSGSGKSTILNLVGMLERPNTGDVELCGMLNPRIESRLGRKLLRTRVAYLFQSFALVDDATVRTNLTIPLQTVRLSRQERSTRMRGALDTVGLAVPLTQRVSALSGGEQQRLAVARVLLRPADVVLADEPTGSLDPANRDAILSLLQGMHGLGRTIVVVTHDPVVVDACERTVTLSVRPVTRIGAGSGL